LDRGIVQSIVLEVSFLSRKRMFDAKLSSFFGLFFAIGILSLHSGSFTEKLGLFIDAEVELFFPDGVSVQTSQ